MASWSVLPFSNRQIVDLKCTNHTPTVSPPQWMSPFWKLCTGRYAQSHAHKSAALWCEMVEKNPKLPLPPQSVYEPHLKRSSLGPPASSSQTSCRLGQLFLCSSSETLPIDNNVPLPKNSPFPWGDLGCHLIYGSLGRSKSIPKWHIKWLSILAQLMVVTNRQTMEHR